ncbi:Protein of unknown function [Bacillus cereus]|nr:Protein of unknown function [Bacillus cereus]
MEKQKDKYEINVITL